MSNRLPLKDRMRDHPMFATEDTCDKCGETIDPEGEMYDLGKGFYCRSCYDNLLDEAENYFGGDR